MTVGFVILQIDADEHSQDDPKVMTFSEIMAAKRQRQKRLAEKKNADVARKNSIDNLELPQEDFGTVKLKINTCNLDTFIPNQIV